MPESNALGQLTAFVAANPEVQGPLGALLARSERGGRLPKTMTLDADAAAARALQQLFSTRAVTPAGAGRVQLDLARSVRETGLGERELLQALYAALGREPRDRAADARTLRAELERAILALLGRVVTEPSRSFLDAQLAQLRDKDAEVATRATELGVPTVIEQLRKIVLCLDAIRTVPVPIRVQNFSARVLGSSKALRPGSDLLRQLAAALLDHDPHTRVSLEEQGAPPFRAAELARALEVNGIYQDEAAASVLCFGPLIYSKAGRSFDHVAHHAELGEASRLILHQLRDARIEKPAARRITVFENLTPFLDYVDACVQRDRTDEIVLCSGGQASFAVVALLAGLAKFGLPARHSGDLDRSGVLILRSLRRRSGARLEPLFMDAATHARFQHLGQPLSNEERARLELILRNHDPDPNPLCHDLLNAVLRSGIWIEQEQFSDECLAQAIEG